MKLKFKIWVLLILVPTFGFFFLLLGVLLVVMIKGPERIDSGLIWITLFFAGMSLMLFRDIKFRWNAIDVTDIELLVSPFLGLGPTRRVRFTEITGFSRTKEPSKISAGFALYIYENNKRTIEITDSYCRNYSEFHAALAAKTKKLGKEKLSYLAFMKSAIGLPIHQKVASHVISHHELE